MSGSFGRLNSTWICASRNFSVLWVSPAPVRQLMTPSATVHFDGVPSSVLQPELSRPLNKTTASDGALPGPPGSTTAGCGPSDLWAHAIPTARTNTANTRSFFILTSPWLVFCRTRSRFDRAHEIVAALSIRAKEGSAARNKEVRVGHNSVGK